MFFKNFILVIVLTVFSSSVFGQAVCGWEQITPENAPQALKNGYGIPKDTVQITVQNDPGPSGGSKSIEILNIAGPDGGIICGKYFGIPTDGDSFEFIFDTKGCIDSSGQIFTHFLVLSQGITYLTKSGCPSISWGTCENKFIPRDIAGNACKNLDTLYFLFAWNGLYPKRPFGVRIDNLKIRKLSSGQIILIDSLGENQSIEEESVISNLESVKIFPNPFCSSIKITGASNKSVIKIYDKAGKLVKSILDFSWDGKDAMGRKCPNGMYFVKIQIENKAITQKVVLMR